MTPARLARKRQGANDSMNDECLHRERTWEENTFGELEEVLADAETYPCGLDTTSSTETTAEGEMRITDAMLRLPLSTEGVVKATDQVVITKRYHEDLVRMPAYEVIGEPMRGPTAITLKLQEVIE